MLDFFSAYGWFIWSMALLWCMLIVGLRFSGRWLAFFFLAANLYLGLIPAYYFEQLAFVCPLKIMASICLAAGIYFLVLNLKLERKQERLDRRPSWEKTAEEEGVKPITAKKEEKKSKST